MAYAYIDINLDAFNTNDFIDELESRNLGKREIARLHELISDSNYLVLDIVDKTKLDLIKKIIDKYSIIELQSIFEEIIIDTKTMSLFD